MATQTKMATSRLIVAYFPRSASAAELQGVFGQHVAVQAARIVRDRNGDSRCYGFVDFYSIDDATSAFNACKRGDIRLVDDKGKTWYLKAEHANAMQGKRARGVRGGANKKKAAFFMSAPNPNEASIDLPDDIFFEDEHLLEDIEDPRIRLFAERNDAVPRFEAIPKECHFQGLCHTGVEEDVIDYATIESFRDRRTYGGDRQESNSNQRRYEDDHVDGFQNQQLAERHRAGLRNSTNPQEHRLFSECNIDDSRNQHIAERYYVSAPRNLQEHHLYGEESFHDSRSRHLAERHNAGARNTAILQTRHLREDDYFDDSRDQHLFERPYAGARNERNPQEHRMKSIIERRCSYQRYCEEEYADHAQNQHFAQRYYAGARNKANLQTHDLRDACTEYLEQDKIGDVCMKPIFESRRSGGGRRVYTSRERYSDEDHFDDSRDRRLAECHYAGDHRSKPTFKEGHFTRVGSEFTSEAKYFGRPCITHVSEDVGGYLMREDDRFDVRGNRNLSQKDYSGIPRSYCVFAADRFLDSRTKYVSEDHHYGGSDRRYATEDVHRIHSRDQRRFVDGQPASSSEDGLSYEDVIGKGYSQNDIGTRCQQNQSQIVFSL